MSVRVQVPGFVALVRMMGARLFRCACWWSAFVAVALGIQITWNVALVRMMGAGFLGGLIGHDLLLGLMQGLLKT